MKKMKPFGLIIIVTALVGSMLACNFPLMVSQTETQAPNLTLTALYAEELSPTATTPLIVTITEQPTEPATITATATATATATCTTTATATATETPTKTATPNTLRHPDLRHRLSRIIFPLHRILMGHGEIGTPLSIR